MEQNQKLADLHSEHADWQNQIAQLNGIIKNLNNRLGAMVTKFTPRHVPSHVEHFQNQFILQKEVLDIMRHDFKQYENAIEDEQKKNVDASSNLMKIRNAYQQRLIDYNRILDDLENEFEVFEKSEVVNA
jgi:peptidoglycan hydrolase CwlO-like protein